MTPPNEHLGSGGWSSKGKARVITVKRLTGGKKVNEINDRGPPVNRLAVGGPVHRRVKQDIISEKNLGVVCRRGCSVYLFQSMDDLYRKCSSVRAGA